MKKLIPVLYFVVGLAFIAQSAGFIPNSGALPKWFPLVIGWCFIILGIAWVVKAEKARKKEPSEAEKTEDSASC